MMSRDKQRDQARRGLAIAVVDDDQSNRIATARLLQSFGFQVDVFSTAEEFLNSSRLHAASCLVLDLQLPGMSGLEAQSHLAKNGHNIPIIFVTGLPDNVTCAKAMNAGAIAYLYKPFTEQALLNAIHTALEST